MSELDQLIGSSFRSEPAAREPLDAFAEHLIRVAAEAEADDTMQCAGTGSPETWPIPPIRPATGQPEPPS